jgi:membrane-bound serine protease (ClpP class)
MGITCLTRAAILSPGALIALLALGALLGLAAVATVRIALHARRAKNDVRTSGVIGLTGRAETAVAREGAVFVRGELWRARSSSEIARGERVKVVGVDGPALKLIVERDDEG